ncbi:ABC transporter permease [Streptomyces litchfieldiae]|uniref:ABC transporter permease n=1 Tax=Streptomyces litchfieldiae TaxID=3075543 RepID=A0ABU2MU65_9ACTN|nr:ABC transporter permease [Streptomyces sp. DSM 44938]MDT0345016.1 ABC transporter permease [Streptomyces sp. DSM 44938]
MTAATATRPPDTAPAPQSHGRGNALAGTGALLRFNLRRDRIRLPVWIGALFLVTLSSVSSLESSYPEPEDWASMKDTLGGPAGLAMSGPEHYLSGEYNFGAMTGHQFIGFMGIMVAIMSVLTVVRHTRTEEETGRAELLRSNVVGRHAHMAAALTVAVAANLVLALLLAAGLGSQDLAGITSSGSVLYGATSAAIGISFAAIAAVTVQITAFSRGASGLGMAAIGVAYALRAVGDVGTDAFSWLSPIGWAQRTYVYVDDRWWPLLLNLGLIVGAIATGFFLSTRRDVGAGLRPPRPGRPTASDALARPVGFALRLHRGVLIGFAAGAALFSLMYGSILGDAEELLEDNDQLRETVERLGGDIVESFASVVMSLLAIVAAAYVVMATLRPRAEETGGRAEPVLATGLSRTRWVGSHLTVALIGGTLIMLLAGVGFGISGAASADDGDLMWKLIGASLAYAPALWVTAGISVTLLGWFPKASAAAWVVPAYAFFVVYLGELTDLPDALSNLSPIGHVPQVPAADLEWTPLLVMTALAAGLVWLGLLGFRRRDLETK